MAQVEQAWPAVDVSVPEARAWVRGVLAPEVPADTVDAAELVVSELAANAIVHTRSERFSVYVFAVPFGVCVAVSDQGTDAAGTVPAPRAAEDTACGGRGLALVEAMAQQVTVSGDAGGRTVSAVLGVAEPAAAERGAV